MAGRLPVAKCMAVERRGEGRETDYEGEERKQDGRMRVLADGQVMQ